MLSLNLKKEWDLCEEMTNRFKIDQEFWQISAYVTVKHQTI